VVTHTNILASVRSTRLSNPASLLNGMLSYRHDSAFDFTDIYVVLEKQK